MLALIFDGQPKLRDDYLKPRIGPGEALVAVRLAGICQTDLEVLKGYMGFSGVMGHEFVGVVEDGPRQWQGKRVVGEINCVCSRCDMCKAGLSNHCRNRTVVGIAGRDGAFAQYLALPAANLHQVPDNVPDEHAVLIEPLAAAFQVVRQVKMAASVGVVVLGDGRLGQLIARILNPRLRRLVMVGKHQSKLEAAEKQGIATVLAEEFVPMAMADVVIDATGSASGFDLAMRTVRPRGTIILKSTSAAREGMNLSPLVINEVNVVGSRCGPFPDAIKALAGGKLDVSALVGRTFPLTRGVAALEAASRGDCMKVVLNAQE
jgi:threonine dehydrogenase-like Zn-dependent dehydrogenase